MRGEDIQGLTTEELQQLEKTLKTGLSRVLQRKGEKIMEQINDLRQKGMQLMEENSRLRQQVAELSRAGKPAIAESENASSESVTNLTHSVVLNENVDSSDTSLRLSCQGWNWAT
ncbi:hypothetical protein HPP92_013142 [Vanilla planifolia]|uniref:K-box domain-containing protein n=1 Tax=Vanilla planifolia TaxID=51239 RepID=A0A835QMV3_VANPL|nr:hypothetical protein HPP92_013142 [Vanilla planifolia]